LSFDATVGFIEVSFLQYFLDGIVGFDDDVMILEIGA